MEAESLELEDGEVVDDEAIDAFGAYNVLQRPHVPQISEKPSKTSYSDESDETSVSSASSGSDSDSAKLNRVKRPKIKVKRRRLESHGTATNDKTDKYKIWCTQVQEESLTENLVSCGVTKKLYQGRNVENYDLPAHYKLKSNEDETNNSSEEEQDTTPRLNNKRTNTDRKNVKLRLGKRRNSMDIDTQKGSVKIMEPLGVTQESTDDEVANDIAEKLNEKKDCLIKRVVDIIGKEKAMEFYEKTRKIEEGGGMMIMNGERRRTSGGIYLWLIKTDDHIPQEKIREVFSMDKKLVTEQRKKIEACNRRQKTQELMRSLENGSEKDLPGLLTRAELSTRQIAEEARLRRGEGMDRNLPDSDRTVSNPPPSPVTDDPDHSEHQQQQQREQQIAQQTSPPDGQRRIQSYNDDFLDIGLDVDSMEVF